MIIHSEIATAALGLTGALLAARLVLGGPSSWITDHRSRGTPTILNPIGYDYRAIAQRPALKADMLVVIALAAAAATVQGLSVWRDRWQVDTPVEWWLLAAVLLVVPLLTLIWQAWFVVRQYEATARAANEAWWVGGQERSNPQAEIDMRQNLYLHAPSEFVRWWLRRRWRLDPSTALLYGAVRSSRLGRMVTRRRNHPSRRM